MNADAETDLSLDFLRRYVNYARTHMAPRLDAAASRKLISNYVRMRNPHENDENRTPAMRHSMLVILKDQTKVACTYRAIGHTDHCTPTGGGRTHCRVVGENAPCGIRHRDGRRRGAAPVSSVDADGRSDRPVGWCAECLLEQK